MVDGVPRVHHVVPHALGQLFVTLYGEVEAVVGEEGHVDLPVLLRQQQVKISAALVHVCLLE